MIKLSSRLAAVAALAGSGGSVIDVGTDHGYVPVFFAQNGLFDRVAASDIAAGPLESATASAREYGVEGKIEFHLSDGLKAVPGPFDTVVIAGMGGETMIDMISACRWILDAKLVLQPQSRIPELKAWLDGAGFTCEDAVLVTDAGKTYTAFRAGRGEGGFDLLRALMERRDPLLPGCLDRERARVSRALSGMERGARQGSAEYARLLRQREKTERAIMEVYEWQR